MDLKNGQTLLVGHIVFSGEVTDKTKDGKEYTKHRIVIEDPEKADAYHCVHAKPNSEYIKGHVGDLVHITAWVTCYKSNKTDKYFYNLNLSSMRVLQEAPGRVEPEEVAQSVESATDDSGNLPF